jgi:hypothetical protein
MDLWLAVGAMVVLMVVYVLLPVGLAMRSYFDAPRRVRCPIKDTDAAILVGRTGMAEVLGRRSLRRVDRCSFWPRRQGCEQRCLDAPDEELPGFSGAA